MDNTLVYEIEGHLCFARVTNYDEEGNIFIESLLAICLNEEEGAPVLVDYVDDNPNDPVYDDTSIYTCVLLEPSSDGTFNTYSTITTTEIEVAPSSLKITPTISI